MGWFFGSNSAPEGNDTSSKSTDLPSSSKDPISSLEPSLREYLQSQFTKSTTSTSERPPASSEGRSSERDDKPDTDTPPPPHASSAYGDRYADLWKTYRPSEDVVVSDQQALTEVMQAHRARKAEIGRAALENCAEVQLALHECFKSGGLWGRLTSCGKQAKKLDECYATQVKFLRALGYMSDLNRPKEVDEKIQMHADKLYQEQLREDKDLEEAYKRRREVSDKGEKPGEEGKGDGFMAAFTTAFGPSKGEEVIGRTKVGGVEVVIEPAKEQGDKR